MRTVSPSRSPPGPPGPELAHLLRHHAEALAFLARARGLDRGVEREHVGLLGDRLGLGDELLDLLRRGGQGIGLARGVLDFFRQPAQLGAAEIEPLAMAARQPGQGGVPLRGLPGASGQLLRDAQDLPRVLRRGAHHQRLLPRALGEIAGGAGHLLGRGAHLLGRGRDLLRHGGGLMSMLAIVPTRSRSRASIATTARVSGSRPAALASSWGRPRSPSATRAVPRPRARRTEHVAEQQLHQPLLQRQRERGEGQQARPERARARGMEDGRHHPADQPTAAAPIRWSRRRKVAA